MRSVPLDESASDVVPADRWPLVGRAHHLDLIETAYTAAVPSAGGGGVVIVGPPGVGRTRLASEAATRLSRRGCRVGWASPSRSGATVPLGALATLLAPADRLPSGEPSLEAMARLAARFPAGADPRPALAVDDAHLLDGLSAALLRQLATEGRAFVLLTVRAGALVPDAVTALWTAGTASRVELAALPDPELADLLRLALGGPMDAVSAGELRRACAGSPLLLRELLVAGQQTGSLHRAGGLWRWDGEGCVTDRLVDVVHARLGRLPPALTAVAELLALGGPLPAGTLAALTDPDTVALAERRGLITTECSGRRLVTRLAQPVYSTVFRATTPRARQRDIWRQLGMALAATPMRRAGDALAAATAALHANLAAAPDLLLTAAEQAAGRLDLELATQLATRAREAGAGARAGLLLAEVLTQQGRYAAAARALPATPPPVPGEGSRWRVARLRIGQLGPGRRGPAAVPGPGADPDMAASASWLLVAEGRNVEALALAQSALAAGDARPAAANWAAAGGLAAAGLLGHHDQVAELLEPALASADRYRETSAWGPVQVAASGCVALVATGRLDDAERLAGRAYRAAVDTAGRLGRPASAIVGAAAATVGLVAKTRGRARPALAALTEAAALLADWPAYRLHRICLAELAATHALLGDAEAATGHLRAADQQDDPPVPVFDSWVERARSWVAAAAGDLTQATAHALNAGALARDSQQPTIEALALFDAARFGEPRAARRLTLLADRTPLPVIATLAAASGALRRSSDAATLDTAAARLAGHGHLLYAAEAARAAHIRHATAGRRAPAHGALTLATSLTGECAGARTPLLAASEVHEYLTARERQVAALAAAGHTSAKIAARLGLSGRTVNNHLGRVYQKLGISGRVELRAALALPDAAT